MVHLADVAPGQIFAWQGGIFVRSDATKRSEKLNLPLSAVTVIRKTMPTISGLPSDVNLLGATVWMRTDTDVTLLTADIYMGDKCIHRMWENQVDDSPEQGIVEA